MLVQVWVVLWGAGDGCELQMVREGEEVGDGVEIIGE